MVLSKSQVCPESGRESGFAVFSVEKNDRNENRAAWKYALVAVLLYKSFLFTLYFEIGRARGSG